MNRCSPNSTCADAHASSLRAAFDWYAVQWDRRMEMIQHLGEACGTILIALAIVAMIPFGWIPGLVWRRTARLDVAAMGACEYHAAKERTS